MAVIYEELVVWQRSMELVKEIYLLVRKLPKEETYALSDQMRRAVVSIPSNIAEGYGRKSKTEYIRFLDIARGSQYELETQIQICVMLEFINEKDAENTFTLISEVGKMLNVLINKLQSNPWSLVPSP
ncbi:MAG: four helix bundle protein [Clostridia bacterium]|nr:four helix bundle protein [Clostridia bacterium]